MMTLYVHMLFGVLMVIASFFVSLVGGLVMALVLGTVMGREMVVSTKTAASFYLFVVAGYMLGDFTYNPDQIILVSLGYWGAYAIGRMAATRDQIDSTL